ncbi:MFS transporter [Metabacillus sp. RGM 3146]|uniref:MFS transporter n=1 Tax=Metabacillus sp. RGM 3146 TaxID=3401092 RepID=UPI003B9AF012
MSMELEKNQEIKNQSKPKIKKTNVRWKISILLWAAIAVNYLDRTVLSATTPELMKDFGLNAAEMGLIMSAFFWSYALFQIPAGWLADKVGQRFSLAFSVAWWSVATALTAASQGLKSLLIFRVLLGVGEAGAYPSSAGVTAKWFPDKERTRVSAIFDSGSKVGTALAMPFVVWLMTAYGWKVPFIVSGLLGLIWVCIWWAYYRDPEKHMYVSKDELKYIRDGQVKKDGLNQIKPIKWYELLKYRNILAMCVGFFLLNYAIYFFITWFPTYLVNDRGFELMKMGWVSMIPPLFGLLAELAAGAFSDHLYSKGHSLTFVRKLNLVGGMLLATSIAFAGLVSSPVLSIVLMSISYGGLTTAACAIWSLPGDVAPPNMTSVVGGLQNCVSNFGGILGPIVTGFIISATGSFIPALIVSGVATLLGAITYMFWLGKVEPIVPKSGPADKTVAM